MNKVDEIMELIDFLNSCKLITRYEIGYCVDKECGDTLFSVTYFSRNTVGRKILDKSLASLLERLRNLLGD